ncbi:hypothetical protein GGE65_006239 [Skermanella aerolata]|uniref:AAA family ATPase n=1 Tax=Skermanella aerolata TaxID=393310 RepID=UPI003D1AAB77
MHDLMIWRISTMAEIAGAPDDFRRQCGAILDATETSPAVGTDRELQAIVRDWGLRARALDEIAWIWFAENAPGMLCTVIDNHQLNARLQRDVRGTFLMSAALCGLKWARWLLIRELVAAGAFDKAAEVERSFDHVSVMPWLVLSALGIDQRILKSGIASFPVLAHRMLDEIEGHAEKVRERLAEIRSAERSADDPGRSKKVGVTPVMHVLLRPAPLPSDREFRPLFERANRALMHVPLSKVSEPDIVARVLLAEFPWLGGVVEEFHGHLTLSRRLGGTLIMPPTVIVGPPGCGKTRFVRRLAELCGTPHTRLPCAGLIDNRTLAGTARGWGSQTPSLPAMTIMRTGRVNPIIILDEIDKMGGSDHGGRSADTLLNLLEPETARSYFDEALTTELDLSRVCWIGTVNHLSGIPALLRSRLGFIDAAHPWPQDFDAILTGCLEDIARTFGGPVDELPDLGPISVGPICRRETGRMNISEAWFSSMKTTTERPGKRGKRRRSRFRRSGSSAIESSTPTASRRLL